MQAPDAATKDRILASLECVVDHALRDHSACLPEHCGHVSNNASALEELSVNTVRECLRNGGDNGREMT